MTRDTLNVDVVIVGAGPAGLMAGTWMAQTGVTAIIIDQKPHRTQSGHADGIESRTFEILDSFGVGDNVWKNANPTIDLSIWNHQKSGGIKRGDLLNNCNPGLSRFQEATLGQGQIEQNFLDFIDSFESVSVKWNTCPTNLTIFESSEYPVQLMIQTRNSGMKEHINSTIRAKYLVGCDGAHSWVRDTLGLSLEGDRMNEHWGVFDSIPLTDFPDIRKRCIIKANAGHLMIIPREKRLVRCYVQLLPEVAAALKVKLDPETLVNIVREILSPFSFEASSLEWASIYSVAQKLCPRFSKYNRVFLAGDAIHTHSPKAGQGMNVSIQDTYNLGWKLASVIKGKARPMILRTYQEERLLIAMRLLAFDKRMVEGICGKESDSSMKGLTSISDSLRNTLQEENTSSSGLTARYGPSCLVTPACESERRRLAGPLLPHSRAELAGNMAIGVRFNNAQVLLQCDSKPYNLQQVLRSTGEWRLLVFGGDISNSAQMKRVQQLGLKLVEEGSIFCKTDPNSADRVGEIEAFLIHCAPRKDVEFMKLPEVFRPFDETMGYDYWRVFADNDPYGEGRGNAHRLYGIGTEGCVVLVRPDQHVAFIGALEDLSAIELFLLNIMTGL
ncbi:hypothetical protein N7493_010779 [Penicillium malachiteum]|uniref:Uncharacterized protein n=1 Tax=Penicillium malachiteum TaxID=1324776 RepID=A0AAD6MRU4_9EURO|nr:hypothetical protein N7493_010779 [Penicillium malachiteum]